MAHAKQYTVNGYEQLQISFEDGEEETNSVLAAILFLSDNLNAKDLQITVKAPNADFVFIED